MQIIESEGVVGIPKFVASLSDMPVAWGPLKLHLVSEVRGLLCRILSSTVKSAYTLGGECQNFMTSRNSSKHVSLKKFAQN